MIESEYEKETEPQATEPIETEPTATELMTTEPEAAEQIITEPKTESDKEKYEFMEDLPGVWSCNSPETSRTWGKAREKC